jgi:hypothetical protein
MASPPDVIVVSYSAVDTAVTDILTPVKVSGVPAGGVVSAVAAIPPVAVGPVLLTFLLLLMLLLYVCDL